MSWFSLKEYGKYRWRAKHRHGVHSPLVYGLMDVGLKDYATKNTLRNIYKNEAEDTWESNKLMAHIVDYFQFSDVKKWNHDATFLSYKNASTARDIGFDICYDFGEHSLEEVLHFFLVNKPIFSELDVLFVGNMHQSKQKLATWRILQEQPQVTLSLDFFSLGILLFSKKIKERQHFILKP